MITSINTKKDFEFYLPELIMNYRKMFSEAPFNNPNITIKYATMFFKNTFKNGVIFISTPDNNSSIDGFRTIIKSEEFKDFYKLNLEQNSIYLSCLWVSPKSRQKGIGNGLMEYSLNLIQNKLKIKTIYVRTRNDTPKINSLLNKTGFTPLKSYLTQINNQDLKLTLHCKKI